MYTEGFAPTAELRATGATAQTDLYAVGRLLSLLFKGCADATMEGSDSRPPEGPLGQAIVSFRRLVRRATDEPGRRFASAAEMVGQLSGVLREIVALREGRSNAAPALLFAPALRLLGHELGAPPPLQRWLTIEARQAAAAGTCLPLADGRPGLATIAADLPAPQPDPADPGAGFVAQLGDAAPSVVLDKLTAFESASAEAQFARCRAHLGLGDLSAAHASLEGAVTSTRHDWRASWHRGLLALAEGRLMDARRAFDAVYSALPGETAAKLALALCAERLAEPGAAERYYDTVWQSDPVGGECGVRPGPGPDCARCARGGDQRA
jgi:serine/threonine-protein kinase PknG